MVFCTSFSSSHPSHLHPMISPGLLREHVQTNLNGKVATDSVILCITELPLEICKDDLAYQPEIISALLLLCCRAREALTITCHLPGFTQWARHRTSLLQGPRVYLRWLMFSVLVPCKDFWVYNPFSGPLINRCLSLFQWWLVLWVNLAKLYFLVIQIVI